MVAAIGRPRRFSTNFGTEPGAKLILDWLKRTRVSNTSRSEMQQALRAHFKRAADVDVPIARLVEAGWLRPARESATRGGGRPPSPRFAVHPSIR